MKRVAANANLSSPSPLAGEGWGGGCEASNASNGSPPSRTALRSDLPRKGGGKETEHRGGEIRIAGVTVFADCGGALYWPDEGILVVADLHLEKGSSFAKRGVFLPPYDTASTLARLGELIARYAPRCVIALGDNFHDGGGADRLQDGDRDNIRALQRGRDWVWITGNHDPEPAQGIGGFSPAALAVGALTFRHKPTAKAEDGEIAGHLHPVARVTQRGRTVSRRCFATNGQQAVMPAFGAYTGGLNIRHHAFVDVFGGIAFTAHMLGDGRLYAFTAKRCMADA